MSTRSSFSRYSLVFGAGILMILIVGLSAVIAQPLVQPDGRLNQIAHFGGDALYCMDAADNVTNDSATFDYFLLRDASGQALWTLSKEQVELGLGQIALAKTAFLLGEGDGTYGPVYLFGNAAADGSPYFIFIGFDEYGKENRLIFYGCTPEGSALSQATPSPIAPV